MIEFHTWHVVFTQHDEEEDKNTKVKHDERRN